MDTQSQLVSFLQMVLDEKRRGKARIEDLATAVDKGQQDLYDHYLELEVGERGNEPTNPASGYGSSQITLNALRPFRTIFLPDALSNNGEFPLPQDMGYMLGLFKNEGDVPLPVREVLTDELYDAVKSKLIPIASNPVFTTDGNTIKQYPPSIYATELHYLRRPKSVVIIYDVNGNEQVVDDNHVDSVPPDFAPMYWPQICTRALAYLGVSLSDAEVFALSQQP